MFAKILRDKISKITEKKCIVFENKSYTYGDIINSWDMWNVELKAKEIYSSEVVMVRGHFNVNSIGLMLALIERNCIYVPVSTAIKNIKRYQQIAEVAHYFNLEDNTYTSTGIVPQNELTKRLLKLSDPGLVLFSSGTTGEPKAALHNIKFMLKKYEIEGKAFTSIAFLLFDHIGGFNTVLYSLANGGTIVVPINRSPENIINLIEKYEVEILPTSPSFINMLLISKAYETADITTLKTVTYGTEPMPQATLETFNNLFPEIRLKQTYGLSEVGILRSKSKSSDSLWMKLGDDEHQVDVRDGILWIKSKMSMMGYLNAESPFDSQGWFNTKDQVEIDGDYFKVLGRVSDIINVGGEKVYPNEVESVILTVQGVKEVVVRGETNPLMGNVVVSYVSKEGSIEPNILKKDIKKICKEKLEKFKRPVKIKFVDSEFYTDRFKKGLINHGK